MGTSLANTQGRNCSVGFTIHTRPSAGRPLGARKYQGYLCAGRIERAYGWGWLATGGRRGLDQDFAGSLPFLKILFGFRLAASLSVTSRRPRGRGIGSSKGRDQPLSVIAGHLVCIIAIICPNELVVARVNGSAHVESKVGEAGIPENVGISRPTNKPQPFRAHANECFVFLGERNPYAGDRGFPKFLIWEKNTFGFLQCIEGGAYFAHVAIRYPVNAV
jgi:hypothetical protein